MNEMQEQLITEYAGRFAELYDVFYTDKPYEDEAAFLDAAFRSHATRSVRSVLELACGTGTHAFLLAGMGYDVTATDRSQDMVDRARRKGNSVDFRVQDMRELDVTTGPFDAVVCLFDSIGYVRTTPGILGVLRRVQEHLHPGGVFVFEFWHAPAMLRSFEPVRVRRLVCPHGEIVRVSETKLNVEHSLANVTYTVFEPNTDGTYRMLKEIHTNRYFMCEEMATMVKSAGLEPVAWFDGYQAERVITEETWHVVAVARKP